MSKFLKVIVHTFIVLAILIAAAIIVPPIAGITTTIVDTETMDTNLPMGSVTYSKDIMVSEMQPGDKILKESEAATYAYRIKSGDVATGKYQAINLYNSGSEEEIILRNHVSRVILTVPVIGYVMVAMHSMEGIIILALVLLLMIVLFILSELWKKSDDEDDDDDDDDDADSKDAVSVPSENDDDDDDEDDEEDEGLSRREKKARKKQAKKEAKEEAKRKKAEAKKAKKKRRASDDDDDDEEVSPVISYDERDEERERRREARMRAAQEASAQESIRKDPAVKKGITASLAELLSESAVEIADAAETDDTIPETEEAAEDTKEADIAAYITEMESDTDTDDEEQPAKSIVDRVETVIENQVDIPVEEQEAPAEAEDQEIPTEAAAEEPSEENDGEDTVAISADIDDIVIADITEDIIKEAESTERPEAVEDTIIIEETAQPEDTSFVPVQRLTLDELIEEAEKNGDQPKVIKDPNTNVTLLDYSEIL